MDAVMNALFGAPAAASAQHRAPRGTADAAAKQGLLLPSSKGPATPTIVIKADGRGASSMARVPSLTAEAGSSHHDGQAYHHLHHGRPDGDHHQQQYHDKQQHQHHHHEQQHEQQQQKQQQLEQLTRPAAAVAPSPPPAVPRHYQLALTAAYGVTNLSSVVMIVVANKMVLFTYKFSFAVMLTWLHAIFTTVGMAAMSACGAFESKRVPWTRTLPIAAVYVGFIVFNNLSIQLNPLGFYQMSKLAITPVLVAIERVVYGKRASARVLGSIAVLLVGITLCSVTDSQVSSNLQGILAAVAAVLVTALYQVWAGTKQKELGLNGMQLLQQVSPASVALLAVLIPILEPVGWRDPRPGTILGYELSVGAVTWILISSALGLVVTLSTFLFIGATSSLTYNVVGHLKTLLIVAAGVVFFGEEIGLKKLTGLLVAMAGIVWYSQIKLVESSAAASAVSSSSSNGGGGGSKA
jgi:solute carrier family 35 protein E3